MVDMVKYTSRPILYDPSFFPSMHSFSNYKDNMGSLFKTYNLGIILYIYNIIYIYIWNLLFLFNSTA